MHIADWLFLQITRALPDNQWDKRLSMLAHRYVREYGIAREEQAIEKAWQTLALFCVGEEAEASLQVRADPTSPGLEDRGQKHVQPHCSA
jgi:hypothetical protein